MVQLLSAIEAFVDMKIQLFSNEEKHDDDPPPPNCKVAFESAESNSDLNKRNDYRTVCNQCKSSNRGCHEPCHCVAFGKRIDTCKIFYNANIKRNRCKECGHSVSSHLHMRINTKSKSKNKNKKTKNKIDSPGNRLFQTMKDSIHLTELLINQSSMLLYNDYINRFI